jgi:transcriptional regulator with GAF, ATPase, and Fis domain
MDCLHSLLGIICSVFDAYSTVLFLPGPGSDEYHLAARFSLGDDIDEGTVITAGQGLVGWIIRNKSPLRIANFDQKRSRLGYYRDKNEEKKIKAFMGCPLKGGVGALCLDSKRTYSLSDKDLKILDMFSSLAADMQRADSETMQSLTEHRYYHGLRLLAGLRSRFPKWAEYLRHYLDLLSHTTEISHAFLAVLGDKGTYVLEGYNQPVFEDASQHAAAFPAKSGLIGWVFANNKAVFSGEAEARTASSALFGIPAAPPSFAVLACLPLFISRKTRAVLVLGGEIPVALTDELKTFLEMAADHLAIYLENLHLRSRLDQPQKKV